MIDFVIWTGPQLRPWAPKLVFFIRKLLQFNDFVSDRSPTPAVSSETYIFHSFFFFNLLCFRFGSVPDNDGVNGMRYICMFIINPSQIPSHVQWFRFALCKGRVSYEMGGRVGMNGTRCTIRACVLDPNPTPTPANSQMTCFRAAAASAGAP